MRSCTAPRWVRIGPQGLVRASRRVFPRQNLRIPPRQKLKSPFGSPSWAKRYATLRNTIEGLNGYIKDPAHESLGTPARRRVRGIAAQSIFVAILAMAANLRKIRAYRDKVAQEALAEPKRAKRRRVSLCDYAPT